MNSHIFLLCFLAACALVNAFCNTRQDAAWSYRSGSFSNQGHQQQQQNTPFIANPNNPFLRQNEDNSFRNFRGNGGSDCNTQQQNSFPLVTTTSVPCRNPHQQGRNPFDSGQSECGSSIDQQQNGQPQRQNTLWDDEMQNNQSWSSQPQKQNSSNPWNAQQANLNQSWNNQQANSNKHSNGQQGKSNPQWNDQQTNLNQQWSGQQGKSNPQWNDQQTNLNQQWSGQQGKSNQPCDNQPQRPDMNQGWNTQAQNPNTNQQWNSKPQNPNTNQQWNAQPSNPNLLWNRPTQNQPGNPFMSPQNGVNRPQTNTQSNMHQDGPPFIQNPNNPFLKKPNAQSNSTNECVNPDLSRGTCRNLRDCPEFLNNLNKNPGSTAYAQFLRASSQACSAKPPIVCCPTTKPKILTVEEGCGQPLEKDWKIVGGRDADKGSWPWLALLGYDRPNGIEFQCAGSLITSRHIVTAGHCVMPILCIARLGEHSLNTDLESNHIDVNIVRAKVHPDFSQQKFIRNDIAVLYLAQDVMFTRNIQAICVPDKDTFQSRSPVGRRSSVAGWGRTQEDGKRANELQEARIQILSNAECSRLYRASKIFTTENSLDETVLCAGELEGGTDTCNGDSGGPLILPERFNSTTYYFNLVGIVSYGVGCARAGTPAIYTSVPYFSDWIKECVADIS